MIPTPQEMSAAAPELGLDVAQVKSLSSQIDVAKFPAVYAACTVAQLVLGQVQVDTVPLNQTVVDGNWSEACVASPSCIVQPRSAKDVALALKIIKLFQVKFAVRSGGHSPNPGWSSIDSRGILIDMSKLNGISVSRNGPSSVVSVVLDGQCVFVIGGCIPDVGVGGLILGGGYFHISPNFGLAANVNNFEVVTADRQFINANAKQNSDLFWALKGGRPNFGIITRFNLNTVLDAFGEWQKNGASDPKSNIALVIGLDAITVGLIYAEPPAPPAIFEHDYRAFSSRIDTELTKKMYSFWVEKALAVRESTGAVQTFVLQHIGPALVQYGAQRGGNPLGIPSIPQQWWTTLIDWQDAADDDIVRSVSIETTKRWASLAADSGCQIPFLYINDASRDQNPLNSYGPANLAKLRKVAAKYDPEQMFQKLQNGGFLLSKA
ncbi:hypothetical protein B0I35DRAFT_449346 [Stachybotrys elegans]|uniref:FAD-binding PCMH-type domain-containing protein n=1 Tax=Stachybotrys elegans TaxID=80388 RepID=A0A8K0SWV5_9HYPO|nr:hypothetical protein B0I35DRAFT_449346 [Stachybotrys elegans]